MKIEVNPETDWETVPCILVFRKKITEQMVEILDDFFQQWLTGDLSRSLGTQYASGFWLEGKQIGWSMGFSGSDLGDEPNNPEALTATLEKQDDPFDVFPERLAEDLEGFCLIQGWKAVMLLCGYEEADEKGKGIGFGENGEFEDIFG